MLDSGWFDGFTINTMSPDTKEWVMRAAGTSCLMTRCRQAPDLVVRLQYQVNPTTFGNRDQGVALTDGDTPILTLERETTVFP